MTTHAALPLPRRPFAALDGSRLRNLQNTKNRQNGMFRGKTSSDGDFDR